MVVEIISRESSTEDVAVVVETISSERAAVDLGVAVVVKTISSERSAADITAVVKATSRERAPGDGAVLVVKTISSERSAVDVAVDVVVLCRLNLSRSPSLVVRLSLVDQ